MLASTQTSCGIVQQQDALAGLDVFAGQHEGAVDHRRHRAADGAVLDVDLLLMELRREIGHLIVEGGDLRVDHAQLVMLDPRLVEAAFGLLVLGPELLDLAFELGRPPPAPPGADARWPRGARTARGCARVPASPDRGRTWSAASACSRTCTVEVRVRVSASAWFRLSRRSARSRVRSALTPSICARKASTRSFDTRSSMRTTTWPAATRVPSSAGISITQPSARLETVTISAVTRASYS